MTRVQFATRPRPARRLFWRARGRRCYRTEREWQIEQVTMALHWLESEGVAEQLDDGRWQIRKEAAPAAIAS